MTKFIQKYMNHMKLFNNNTHISMILLNKGLANTQSKDLKLACIQDDGNEFCAWLVGIHSMIRKAGRDQNNVELARHPIVCN